ncbi:MAG: energy transducer TonB [Acidocella sp.]|nr:energy transducer TonB [Acidocella sp.]
MRLPRPGFWLRAAPLLPGLGGCTDPMLLGPAQAQRPGLVLAWTPDTAWAAKAKVSCAISDTGRPQGCVLTHLAGNPAFGPPALAFARSLIFTTGFASGHGQSMPHYLFRIGFQPADRFAPALTKASLAYAPTPPYVNPAGPGRVTLACTITVRGDTQGCVVRTGPAALAPAALALALRAHYLPAWLNGAPVVEPAHPITLNFLAPEHFAGLPGPAANPSASNGYQWVDTTPAYARSGPYYPTEQAYAHHEGSALIGCIIGLDAHMHHCRVVAVHGSPDFGTAARRYMQLQTMRLTLHGKPVQAPYWRIIRFSLAQDQW